ncbi:hypothetical protein [Scytonema sp. PRP1]|uniref:hypothetical protein n=1 Tax=Scytonema sp. PRP1 TaxID=3120513 RepID=UPI002FD4FE2D
MMAQELGTAVGTSGLNVSQGNRRSPIPGLPDWSKAGYREGQDLPSDSDIGYRITANELQQKYNVISNASDSSEGLQKAIDDIKANHSPTASFNKLSLIELPSGTINISKQIYVDADYLIIRGQGSDPSSPTSTKIVFRPDENTRYDALSKDGSKWGEDEMSFSGKDKNGKQVNAKGGWTWPGRGAFRVQVRDVHDSYQDLHNSAPANRKDLLEGSVNFHWRGGFKVLQTVDFPAQEGATVIPLDGSTDMSAFQVGNFLWVQVPVTAKWYEIWGAKKEHYKNFHTFQQIFKITAVDGANKSVTIDKPLEFHVWKNSIFDGSTAIDGKVYDGKVTPLKMVQGVGFENFYLTQEMTNMPKLGGGTYNLKPEDAAYNYGNLAPEYAMHGMVFKWAANCWVRNIHTYMTGSHPIVTEAAKNLQIQDNFLDGSWNKGKGGNGYFRGSRVWDSLYYNNTLLNLRHFTFQWSASNNVAIGNYMECELNLHGGWERRNLFELNTVRVPFEHAPGNCKVNCGNEGGGQDTGQWYPIWWGAGEKASKWSGATGWQNVFFNNILKKQLSAGGSYEDYSPYYSSDGSKDHTIFQFGWNRETGDGSQWEHLSVDGVNNIADWAGNETVDFSVNPRKGVNALRTDVGTSLFLKDAPQRPGNVPGNVPSSVLTLIIEQVRRKTGEFVAEVEQGQKTENSRLGGLVKPSPEEAIAKFFNDAGKGIGKQIKPEDANYFKEKWREIEEKAKWYRRDDEDARKVIEDIKGKVENLVNQVEEKTRSDDGWLFVPFYLLTALLHIHSLMEQFVLDNLGAGSGSGNDNGDDKNKCERQVNEIKNTIDHYVQLLKDWLNKWSGFDLGPITQVLDGSSPPPPPAPPSPPSPPSPPQIIEVPTNFFEIGFREGLFGHTNNKNGISFINHIERINNFSGKVFAVYEIVSEEGRQTAMESLIKTAEARNLLFMFIRGPLGWILRFSNHEILTGDWTYEVGDRLFTHSAIFGGGAGATNEDLFVFKRDGKIYLQGNMKKELFPKFQQHLGINPIS